MFRGQTDNTELAELLLRGGIAVIRTDTLYGIVASANNSQAVERIYQVKKRDPKKSCIVLIASPEAAYGHASELAVDIRAHHEVPTSFLIDGAGAPTWLLRENTELAYRVPALPDLRALLERTGPLVAPSANPEGSPPALTIEQAKQYFGSSVHMYVDGGEVSASTPPSRLVRIHPDGREEWLR